VGRPSYVVVYLIVLNKQYTAMSKPTLEPIDDEELLNFCRFLTENLSRERSPEEWAKAFRQDWGLEKPNNGFLLRSDDLIVGRFGCNGNAEQLPGLQPDGRFPGHRTGTLDRREMASA